MNILKLLASDNYIATNKELIKKLGLEEAVLFGELASEFNYWATLNKLENGYFYSTVENVEEKTTLSAHKQRNALKKLQEIGIVDVKRKGIPAKRFITINQEQLIEILDLQLSKNLTTRDKKNEEVESEEFNGNNNINNNNIINKNINNNISEKRSTRFIPPSVEEVRDYCIERKNNIDAENFVDYYESKGWMIGKNKMKDWKASVRTWERNKYNRKKESAYDKYERPATTDYSEFDR